MNITFTNLKQVILISLFAIQSQAGATSPSTTFSQLLVEPEKFDGRSVTLTGVADVGGDRFFLSIDAVAARTADMSKSIFVARDHLDPRHDRLNNKWVEVTGFVNAHKHGPLGGLPCELNLVAVKMLARPSLPDRNVYGVFRNDTNRRVDLKVAAPSGYAQFEILPHTTAPPVTIANGMVTANSGDGNRVAKIEISEGRTNGQYFDRVQNAFYYRITPNLIEPVLPSATKLWTVYWHAK